MAEVQVRDMGSDDEYFVASCSHVRESDEIDACARRRLAWLQSVHERGVRAKVATLDGEHVGFVYVLPIELAPWGPLGHDLAVLNCLWVLQCAQHTGIGHALVDAAEAEARRQKRKALVTTAYYDDLWFMPAPFFEDCGFESVRRRDMAAILWKVFDPAAEAPTFLERQYQYEPVSGRVVVDLFWNTFCVTSNREAQRVREVAAEFGDAVLLREHCAEDQAVLRRYQIPRGIFVDGREIGWGYVAPRDGVRAAIRRAMEEAGRPPPGAASDAS